VYLSHTQLPGRDPPSSATHDFLLSIFAAMFHDTKLPKDNVVLKRDALNQPRTVRLEGHVARVLEVLQTFRFGSENLEDRCFLRDLGVRIILILILEK
jgi:hypothetical protein